MPDPKALRLLSRFALPPNSLGYCGPDTAPAKLIACAQKSKCAGIDREMTKFIVINPYLETLHSVTGLDKFSYPVAEAYWLGNDRLRKAQVRDYQTLLKNFSRQGIPSWLIDELKKKVPEKFIPFHLFQVLHVGVGRISGSVPYNLNTINNCMIRWGRIKKLNQYNLRVDLVSLKENLGKYELTLTENIFDYRPEFVPGLKIGSTVAVHWGQVVKKLSTRETANLKYWTVEVLRFEGRKL